MSEPASRRRLPPWYVTGLIEGDGTFTYSRSGEQLALYFAIKLRASERPVLEALQAFFRGAGKLYEVRPPVDSERPVKPSCYLRLTRRDELLRVVEHFERYPLRGGKQRAFRVWREMVRLKSESFRRPPREELDALASELSAVSPRGAVARSRSDRGRGARGVP